MFSDKWICPHCGSVIPKSSIKNIYEDNIKSGIKLMGSERCSKCYKSVPLQDIYSSLYDYIDENRVTEDEKIENNSYNPENTIKPIVEPLTNVKNTNISNTTTLKEKSSPIILSDLNENISSVPDISNTSISNGDFIPGYETVSRNVPSNLKIDPTGLVPESIEDFNEEIWGQIPEAFRKFYPKTREMSKLVKYISDNSTEIVKLKSANSQIGKVPGYISFSFILSYVGILGFLFNTSFGFFLSFLLFGGIGFAYSFMRIAREYRKKTNIAILSDLEIRIHMKNIPFSKIKLRSALEKYGFLILKGNSNVSEIQSFTDNKHYLILLDLLDVKTNYYFDNREKLKELILLKTKM